MHKHTVSNLIDLDPDTRKEVMSRALQSYNKAVVEIVNEMGEQMFGTMDWQDLAMLFYFNGFVGGSIATATDAKFRDSVLLMNDEIKYQIK